LIRKVPVDAKKNDKESLNSEALYLRLCSLQMPPDTTSKAKFPPVAGRMTEDIEDKPRLMDDCREMDPNKEVLDVAWLMKQIDVSISDQNKMVIQESWQSVVEKGISYFGYINACFFLQAQPKFIEWYARSVYGRKQAELQVLPRVKQLFVRMAWRIRDWMELLDEPKKLFLALYEHGYKHAKMGIREKEFWSMKSSYMDAIAIILDETMTMELWEIWGTFWDFIYAQIFEGMKGFDDEELQNEDMQGIYGAQMRRKREVLKWNN